MKEFDLWLDRVLDDCMPLDAAAINFNIYEEEDHGWAVQLAAAGYFDEQNEDWACDEVYSSEEDLLCWTEETTWEEVLDEVCDWIQAYLQNGRHAAALKTYAAVAAGFVDGDLCILYMQ